MYNNNSVRKTSTPMLVICAEKDKIYPARISRKLARKYNADRIELKRQDHEPALYEQETAEIISNWIQKT